MGKKIKQDGTHYNDLVVSGDCVVHSALEFIDEQGNITHNDFCPGESNSPVLSENYKQLAHHALDEWLEKGNGTGFFIIKQVGWPKTAKKQAKRKREKWLKSQKDKKQ